MDESNNLVESVQSVPSYSPMSSEDHLVRAVGKLFRRVRWWNYIILAAAAAIVLTAWLSRVWLSGIEWQDLGYPGVFLLSFVGSVSMVLPVPGLITTCGVSVVLTPLYVGVLSGVGEAIGELSGYAVGYGGKTVIQDRPFYRRVRVWMGRRGALIIFVISLIPNPVVDVVGIAAGATRFPLAQFFGIVLVGKILKGIMVAYACYHGIQLLPWM